MDLFKVSMLFVSLAVASLAMPQHHQQLLQLQAAEHHIEEYHHAHPKYEFKYGVKDEHTHDIKEQAEKRDGDRVEGYYKLVEPDGTTRTVHYTADKHTGFHANVQRSGHATHPVYQQVKKVEIPVQHVQVSAPLISHHEPVYSASSYSNLNSHH